MTTAYIRVSTDEQHLGRDAQLEAIRRHIGGEPDFIFSEVVSGAADLDKRPKLLQAIATLEANDVLVVAKLDRLSRCPVTAGLIQHMVHKRGALIQSADGVGNGQGPQDELMRDITLAMAKYERALIIMRTRDALRAKRLRGEKTGGTRPYGFDIVTKTYGGKEVAMLTRNQREYELTCHMEALYEGGWSYTRIAQEMNDAGHKTVLGGKWYGNTVRRVLIRASGHDDEN